MTTLKAVLTKTGEFHLAEPDDLKALSLEMPQAARDSQRAASSVLAAGVELRDDGYAWIPEAWIRSQCPAGPETQEAITNMLEAVQRFGWYDPVRMVVRAHIVWIDA